jgi:hypothetical protein
MILLQYFRTGPSLRVCTFIPAAMSIKMKQQKWFFLLLCLLLLAACEKVVFEPVVIPNDDLSYSLDIQPIFDNKCVSCHPPTKGLDLTEQVSYDELVPEYVTVADSANPAASKLYAKINGSSHSSRTTDIEKQKIEKWISQGVPNN